MIRAVNKTVLYFCININLFIQFLTMVEIHDNKRIIDIQEDFNNAFPYLKIIFITMLNGKILSQEKRYRNGLVKIGEYRKAVSNKNSRISNEQTVSEIEFFFRREYNLIIQVLRKSGKAWLETSVTGDWPLKKQNNEGAQLSSI
jgi:hypothetical protein